MTDRRPTETWIGVTGHRNLGTDPAAPGRVSAECRRLLAARTANVPVVAVSALAVGADTLFAEAALELGLPLVGVVPFADYPNDFTGPDRARLDALLRRCARVERLPFRGRSTAAYRAAGAWIADRADRLVAVWDGRPAAGVGGTGDVVAYAARRGVPVSRVAVER